MRRQPRVVTLDLPDDTESIDGDTEDSEEIERDSQGQDKKQSNDLQLTKQDPMKIKTRGDSFSCFITTWRGSKAQMIKEMKW